MMVKRGRPANQQPATIYDYRRMKTLVDVLTMPDYKMLPILEMLLMQWVGMGSVEVRELTPLEMVQVLALHCTEHGRKQYEE